MWKSLPQATAIGLTLALGMSATASEDPRVRVVHASPDAPNVDVLVNDSPAFIDVEFTEVTDYASLPAGTYNIKVVPTGQDEPVVIEADLEFEEDTIYTVAAVNVLDEIEPLVLIDDDHRFPIVSRTRFVHLSPNAPAVDIAVADGGPVLFPDVEFKEFTKYAAILEGEYDLEVRLAGTDSVVLTVSDVPLEDYAIYTVFAMGLVGEDPPLQAVLSQDFAPCPGDIVPNGKVDVDDLFVVLFKWGECDDDICLADQNGDGQVDIHDLFFVLNNWGPCPH
jgi:hypothetical protein